MYEWIKVGHIVSIISWMVGLLYMPRLMVYHSVSKEGSEKSEIFKVMERRLLKGIMIPAMVSSWLFGIWLANLTGVWFDVWFLIKLLMVILLTLYNLIIFGWVKSFAADENKRPQRFYRIANEIPTVFMVFIVIMVIVRPF